MLLQVQIVVNKLFLLEQFKSTLPEHVSTFFADQNVTSTEDAAILTNEYVLVNVKSRKVGLSSVMFQQRA